MSILELDLDTCWRLLVEARAELRSAEAEIAELKDALNFGSHGLEALGIYPETEPVAYRCLQDDGWQYFDAPTGSDCPDCQPLYTLLAKPGGTDECN